MSTYEDFDPEKLTPNTLSFIALCNEYCEAMEHAAEYMPHGFVEKMVRLLPRIYIAAFDIKGNMFSGEGGYITPSLDEEDYNAVRDTVAGLLGEEDTFLEVFMQDMKYSDTPIATTVSESLADLFQVFFDFLETCRDAPNELINEALGAVRESFVDFWSQTLTNVLRAVNAIYMEGNLPEDE